jgi:hypothetical protein
MNQPPIVLECSPSRARQLLAILEEFAEDCAIDLGEGQDPDEEQRLRRRQTRANWWAAHTRVALAFALPRRRKTHAH